MLVRSSTAGSSLIDLANKKIGVIAGTSNERALAEALKAKVVTATVVTVKTRDEGLEQLEAGTIDAFAGDRVLLVGLASKSKDPKALALLDRCAVLRAVCHRAAARRLGDAAGGGLGTVADLQEQRAAARSMGAGSAHWAAQALRWSSCTRWAGCPIEDIEARKRDRARTRLPANATTQTMGTSGRHASRRLIGLLPAAGRATRLAPLPCSKELLPVGYRRSGVDGAIRPKVASHYLLEKMHAAGAREVYIIVRPGKWDIPEYYADGASFGMDIAYLVANEPLGPPFTLDHAYPFARDATVLFGFPDILFEPNDAFATGLARLDETGADMVVGAYPPHPDEAFDVVEADADGRVRLLAVKEQVGDRTVAPSILGIRGVAPDLHRVPARGDQPLACACPVGGGRPSA